MFHWELSKQQSWSRDLSDAQSRDIFVSILRMPNMIRIIDSQSVIP